jgi:hypothetical protein
MKNLVQLARETDQDTERGLPDAPFAVARKPSTHVPGGLAALLAVLDGHRSAAASERCWPR